jgi:hypothetical protein
VDGSRFEPGFLNVVTVLKYSSAVFLALACSDVKTPRAKVLVAFCFTSKLVLKSRPRHQELSLFGKGTFIKRKHVVWGLFWGLLLV